MALKSLCKTTIAAAALALAASGASALSYGNVTTSAGGLFGADASVPGQLTLTFAIITSPGTVSVDLTTTEVLSLNLSTLSAGAGSYTLTGPNGALPISAPTNSGAGAIISGLTAGTYTLAVAFTSAGIFDLTRFVATETAAPPQVPLPASGLMLAGALVLAARKRRAA